MRAGRLRHRVELQARHEAQNSTGEIIATYVTTATVWASIEPINGREFFAAAQVQSDVTTKIRIRYRDGLTPKMRVRYVTGLGSPSLVELYDIEAVIHVGNRLREIQLLCRKRDAEGNRYE
jgi:SPP1 family predicted phage head-tail adaptor